MLSWHKARTSGVHPVVSLFYWLSHIVLFFAAVGMLGVILAIIFYNISYETGPNIEVIMRELAAACGFLLYVGARAIGVSIPDLIFRSLFIHISINSRTSRDNFSSSPWGCHIMVCHKAAKST
jgi:hypothetical protein